MIDVTNINFVDFYNGARELVEKYKQELELQKVNASGDLSRSVDFDVDYDENSITLYFNMAMYWWYIEKGRRPTGSGGGQAWTNSLQDIQNWIQNKMSRGWWIPRNNKSVPHPDSNNIKSVAWVIRRKIHQKGWYGSNSSGLHILEKVLSDAEASGLIQRMVDSVIQGFDKEVSVELEKL